MALTLTAVTPNQNTTWGNKRVRYYDVTTTANDVVTASAVGLKKIEFVIGPSGALGYNYTTGAFPTQGPTRTAFVGY